MKNDIINKTEIEHFISSFLQRQFGANPNSVNAVIRSPFIVIHLSGFLIPGEEILLKRKETTRVAQTRDILMNGVEAELSEKLTNITKYSVKEIYADWNFEKESALLIVVFDAELDESSLLFPEGLNKQKLHEKIISISKKSQKEPDVIESYWLNDVTILIEQRGIMVDIEKELIKNGVIEELRLAKRPLEHRIMESIKLEPVLNQDVSELFVDWQFDEDKSYMVLILKPN